MAKDYLTAIRQHYTPGNVIFCNYWRTYDLVLAFNEPKDSNGYWSVTVVHCDENGIRSVDWTDRTPRNHCTTPDKRDRIVKTGVQV